MPSMTIVRGFWTVGLLLTLLSGCQQIEDRLVINDAKTGGLWSVKLTCPDFNQGEPIPLKYVHDGQNMSPPLQWVGIPAESRDLILIVQDADSSDKARVHWTAWHLPVDSTGIVVNASRDQHFVEGKNDLGGVGYDGPDPPPGKPHRYYFQLFALGQRLNVTAGATLQTLMSALGDSVLAKGQLVGTYQKPPRG